GRTAPREQDFLLAHAASAQRYANVAAALSTLRTACSPPHDAIRRRVSSSARAGSVACRRSLVGLITQSVNGQLASIRIAPTIQRQSPVIQAASNPSSAEIMASPACIGAARL